MLKFLLRGFMAAISFPPTPSDPLLANLTSLAESFSGSEPSKATETYARLQPLIQETGQLIQNRMSQSADKGTNKLWTQFKEGFINPTDEKVRSSIRSIVILSQIVHICSQLENTPVESNGLEPDPATEPFGSEVSSPEDCSDFFYQSDIEDP